MQAYTMKNPQEVAKMLQATQDGSESNTSTTLEVAKPSQRSSWLSNLAPSASASMRTTLYRHGAFMPNEDGRSNAGEPAVSRRESVRLAAALALGAGLGVPSPLLGAPNMARIQWKVYKALADGGALVESVELSDNLTAFILSAAGLRAQVKVYSATGQQLGSMAMPQLCCVKISP